MIAIVPPVTFFAMQVAVDEVDGMVVVGVVLVMTVLAGDVLLLTILDPDPF